MERMLAGLEAWPVNVGLQAGRAGDRRRATSTRCVEAGAIGFKIHEDYGAYPELIDARPALRRRARRRGRPPHRRAPRVRPSSRTPSRRSPAGRSTPTTSRAAAAATCRTCWASSASRRSSARRRRRRCRTASTPPPSTSPMIAAQPRRRRGRCPATSQLVRERIHRGADGRRRAAPRARRDPDRQLRLAGDGPDRRDGAADDPARPRDEGVAPPRPRGCRPPGRPGLDDPDDATTPTASCATSPR